MLEQQRQQYLSILGVDNYVPNVILPGAAPSVLISNALLRSIVKPDHRPQLHQTDTHVALSGGEKSSNSESANMEFSEASTPSALIKDTVDNHRVVTAEDNQTGQDKSGEEVAQQRDSFESVRFTLTVWRIASDCLIIDSRQPGSALPTDRLLQNILRATGYISAQLPKSEIIRWPLFKEEPHANSEAEACAMVDAYIAAQHARQPLKIMIFMGAVAVRYGFSDGQGSSAHRFNELCGTVVSDAKGVSQVAILPSLHDMLQEPMQKKVAWAALQNYALTD